MDVLVRRTSLAFRGLVTGELLNEVADTWRNRWAGTRQSAPPRSTTREEVLKRYHGVEVHSLVA